VQRIVDQIRAKLQSGRTEDGASGPGAGEIDSQLAGDLSGLFNLSDAAQARYTSHRKIFGALVLAAKRIVRRLLVPVLARQTDYNATNARVVSRLQEHVTSLALQQARLHDEARANRELRAQMSSVQATAASGLSALGADLRALGADLKALAADVQALRAETAPAHELADVRRLTERQDEGLRTIRERMAGAEGRLRRLVAALTNGDPEPPSVMERPIAPAFPLAPAFDSLRFGERFWGSEAEVRERRRVYVDVFRGRDQVLDLGSGRGEFLDLLADAGVPARGVDSDLDMILRCREKGLDVVHEDLFKYLASLPDESLGGIVAAQIVEHFESGQVFELMRLCHRKLRRGSPLVIETPNPRCLMIFAQCFYMDFTHVRPINPEALKFLADSFGFREVDLTFTAPVDPSMQLPRLGGSEPLGPAGEQWNRSLDGLNALLFGHQDYAVIARK